MMTVFSSKSGNLYTTEGLVPLNIS